MFACTQQSTRIGAALPGVQSLSVTHAHRQAQSSSPLPSPEAHSHWQTRSSVGHAPKITRTLPNESLAESELAARVGSTGIGGHIHCHCLPRTGAALGPQISHVSLLKPTRCRHIRCILTPYCYEPVHEGCQRRSSQQDPDDLHLVPLPDALHHPRSPHEALARQLPRSWGRLAWTSITALSGQPAGVCALVTSMCRARPGSVCKGAARPAGQGQASIRLDSCSALSASKGAQATASVKPGKLVCGLCCHAQLAASHRVTLAEGLQTYLAWASGQAWRALQGS